MSHLSEEILINKNQFIDLDNESFRWEKLKGELKDIEFISFLLNM